MLLPVHSAFCHDGLQFLWNSEPKHTFSSSFFFHIILKYYKTVNNTCFSETHTPENTVVSVPSDKMEIVAWEFLPCDLMAFHRAMWRISGATENHILFPG